MVAVGITDTGGTYRIDENSTKDETETYKKVNERVISSFQPLV